LNFHFTIILFSIRLQWASVSNARISVKKAGCGERNFRDRRNGEKCDFHEETKALRKDPYFRSRVVNAAVGSLSRLQASQPQIGGGSRNRTFVFHSTGFDGRAPGRRCLRMRRPAQALSVGTKMARPQSLELRCEAPSLRGGLRWVQFRPRLSGVCQEKSAPAEFLYFVTA